MAFETQGTILEIMPLKTVGQKDFKIQEFVVELSEKDDKSDPVMFQLIGERHNVLNEGNFNINDEVKFQSLQGMFKNIVWIFCSPLSFISVLSLQK